jgi:hypothetical protein
LVKWLPEDIHKAEYNRLETLTTNVFIAAVESGFYKNAQAPINGELNHGLWLERSAVVSGDFFVNQ